VAIKQNFGKKDVLTHVGTIAAPFSSGVAGGICAPFQILTTQAIKTIFLYLSGTVNVATNNLSAVLANGVHKLLQSIAITVNKKPGAIALNGYTLHVKNLKDHGFTQPFADLASVNLGNGKAFSACFRIDFVTPGYPGGDATMFKPLPGFIYNLEIAFDAVTRLGTPANAGEMTWAAAPTIDVVLHEILDVEKTPNVYNSSYLLTFPLTAISSDFKVPLPYGGKVNEYHLHATDANGLWSNSILNKITLRNGQKEVMRALPNVLHRAIQDSLAGMPAAVAAPTGVYYVDLALNNSFRSVRDTTGMTELQLGLDVAALGTLYVLVNEFRQGADVLGS